MPEKTNINPDEFAIGSVLADTYQIENELGQGGQALVLKALDLKNYRNPVVIKVLLDGRTDAWARKKFEQEKEALAKLQGLNGVVKLIGNGTSASGKSFMVLEYLGDVKLRMLNDELSKNLQRAARLFRQIASTMSYVHDKGVYHRDLKSINIMVVHPGDFEETAKIIDFGIVRMEESVLSTDTTQSIVGTPFYISPNAIAGNPSPKADDIYSLGMLAYEMLTGDYPIPRSDLNIKKIADMQINVRQYPPSEKNPALSSAVNEIIFKALSVDPEQRQSSARELGESLYRALFEIGNSAEKTLVDPPVNVVDPRVEPPVPLIESPYDLPITVVDPPPAPPPKASRVPKLALVMAAALLTALGIGAWQFLKGTGNDGQAAAEISKPQPAPGTSENKAVSSNTGATPLSPENAPANKTAETPAQPPSVVNPESIALRISKRDKKNNEAIVFTHDVFKAGDGMRVAVRPKEEMFLRAVMLENNGAHREIYSGRPAKDYELTLPAAGKWYFFDDKPGTETIFLIFDRTDPGKIADPASLLKEAGGRGSFTRANGSVVRVLSFRHIE